jgi:hypothetical protein
MRATCPDCGTQGHLAAFFAEEDGKRFAAQLADLEPALGRAVIGYLGLFKPAKNALQLRRAIALVDELRQMVLAGTVCRDERVGVRRAATQAMWATGIEQMLAQRASLTLPLASHGYLRAVVYGLADSADAAAERQRESDARAGRHLAGAAKGAVAPGESKLQNALRHIDQQLSYGAITEDQARQQQAEARSKYGRG